MIIKLACLHFLKCSILDLTAHPPIVLSGLLVVPGDYMHVLLVVLTGL